MRIKKGNMGICRIGERGEGKAVDRSQFRDESFRSLDDIESGFVDTVNMGLQEMANERRTRIDEPGVRKGRRSDEMPKPLLRHAIGDALSRKISRVDNRRAVQEVCI